VFASPSAVEGWIGEMGTGSLSGVRLVAIGPATARRIAVLTDSPTTIARTPDVLGLVSAVVTAARGSKENVYVHSH
jgi:uroporphyrinogen-III synthase